MKDWAHQEMLRLLRALTPSERMQMVVRAIDASRQIDEAAQLRLSRELESKSLPDVTQSPLDR